MVKKFLMAIIAGGAMLIFLVLVIYAAMLTSDGTPEQMPAFAITTISSVNGILLANLGTILGIGLGLRGGFRRLKDEKTSVAQLFAAIFYCFVLVGVFLYWATQGFTEDPEVIVKSIPEIGRTSIGIAIAVLGSWLGVEGLRAVMRPA